MSLKPITAIMIVFISFSLNSAFSSTDSDTKLWSDEQSSNTADYVQPKCGEGLSDCINECVRASFKNYKEVEEGTCRAKEAFCDIKCGGW
jgi:hypothetical protein